jgi:hypothetical protein
VIRGCGGIIPLMDGRRKSFMDVRFYGFTAELAYNSNVNNN